MTTATGTTSDHARKIEDLRSSILAFSDLTDKLQRSHEQLSQQVRQLQSELSEKNRLLERRNRLAALGEMAAGMAHEIRNPLGGIQLYSSILAQDLVDRPQSLQMIHKISGGVKRLEGLVGQVLQFTREFSATVVCTNLSEVIEQAVDLALPQLLARKVICHVNGPNPMHVKVDPLLIGQAVLNLVLNSAEAIENGGTIDLQYGPPIDENTRQFRMIVTDTGPGIAVEVLDRIFNPFFTTKETGTGLGLAIVHRVVEAHDGIITASNADTGGARFEVRI